jgi:hypothetical protein
VTDHDVTDYDPRVNEILDRQVPLRLDAQSDWAGALRQAEGAREVALESDGRPDGRRNRKIRGAAVLVSLAGAAVGAAFVLAGSTNADKGLRASDVLSVLSATTPTTTPPADLTNVRSFSIVDFTQTRELGRHLGQFDSTLFVAPGRGGRSVCYMLYPSPGSQGIGTGYCHPLGDIPQTAKDHYSVSTPWSRVDGEYDMQVFGIVFDDVVEVRVRVNGTWRGVPILKGNGFYLDLPGTRRVDRFEVTLADGTVQGHDFPRRWFAP